jgi:hypothetical protein
MKRLSIGRYPAFPKRRGSAAQLFMSLKSRWLALSKSYLCATIASTRPRGDIKALHPIPDALGITANLARYLSAVAALRDVFLV